MLLKAIRYFIYNPYLRLTIGIVVMIIGFAEAWDSFFDDIIKGNIRLHHGIVLIGFTQVMDALPNIITGLEYIATKDQNR